MDDERSPPARGVPIEPGRPTIETQIPGLLGEIGRLYSYRVYCASTPRDPTLGARAIAWAKDMFGPPASVHIPKKISDWSNGSLVPLKFPYPADHRWDVGHPYFYFHDKTDAAAFKLVWSGDA